MLSFGSGSRFCRDSRLLSSGTLDGVPRCVWGVAGLGAHQGIATVLLVGQFWTSYNLRGLTGPPSSLLDEGLREVLEY